MPTSEYIFKERFFVILPNDALNTEIPDLIKEKLNYNIDDNLTLRDCAQVVFPLKNKTSIVSIQLSPYQLLKSKYVNDYISEDDFELAKIQFNVSEFYTLDEVKAMILDDNPDEIQPPPIGG